MSDEPSPDGAASLRSSQALLRATIALDGVRRMREDAELAAGLEKNVDTSWYADAQVALGAARWLSGSGRRARHPLTVGVTAGSVHNPAAELAALGYLALIAIEEAGWEAAEEHEARARARLAELGFGTNRRCLPMLLARPRCWRAIRRPTSTHAEADVHRSSSTWCRTPGWPCSPTWCSGRWLSSAATGGRPRRTPRPPMRSSGSIPTRASCGAASSICTARFEAARLAEPLTGAERRVLELLPTHLTEAGMAEQLFVTRNTVKTHVKGVYRKLGVASRAEAVRCARDTGLLPPAEGERRSA